MSIENVARAACWERPSPAEDWELAAVVAAVVSPHSAHLQLLHLIKIETGPLSPGQMATPLARTGLVVRVRREAVRTGRTVARAARLQRRLRAEAHRRAHLLVRGGRRRRRRRLRPRALLGRRRRPTSGHSALHAVYHLQLFLGTMVVVLGVDGRRLRQRVRRSTRTLHRRCAHWFRTIYLVVGFCSRIVTIHLFRNTFFI